MFGLLLGNLLVPKVYQGGSNEGDVICFVIAASVCFIVFLHSSCILPESVNRQVISSSNKIGKIDKCLSLI